MLAIDNSGSLSPLVHENFIRYKDFMKMRCLLFLILGTVLGSSMTIGLTYLKANEDFIARPEKWICIDACERASERAREAMPTIKEKVREKIKNYHEKEADNVSGGNS